MVTVRWFFLIDLWCIGCDDPIKNILEKAVIVYQATDNHISQTSGAAGLRESLTEIIR